MTNNQPRKGSYWTFKHLILYFLAAVLFYFAGWETKSVNEAIKIYDESALNILIALSALVIPFVDLIRGGTSGGTENNIRIELAKVVTEILLLLFFSLTLKMMIISQYTWLTWFIATCSYVNLIAILAEVLKIYQYKTKA